jgi:hypothetical protein
MALAMDRPETGRKSLNKTRMITHFGLSSRTSRDGRIRKTLPSRGAPHGILAKYPADHSAAKETRKAFDAANV